MRTIATRLLAAAALAGLAGCGGSLEITPTDGGTDGGSTPSTGSSGGGHSQPTTSMSSSGGAASSSGGSPASTGGVPGDDGACSKNVLAFNPPASTAACWSCVNQGCGTQFAACAGDCSCSATISGDEGCVNGGGGAGCFLSNLASGEDETLTDVINCVAEASVECGCGASPPVDAGAACVQTGGGGSGGNGECTSNFGETCGGTNYQVVCACPESKCFCFNAADPDGGTQVVAFSGCPFCPGGPGSNSTTDLLTLCGFPH